ncbi:hypothetical protein HK102_007868, partial [Quaeritorhiza haematococci]
MLRTKHTNNPTSIRVSWQWLAILIAIAIQLSILTSAHPFIKSTTSTPPQQQQQSQILSPRNPPRSIELRSNGVLIDGKYTILRGGSFQWFRFPPEEWEDRLLKFKAIGFNFLDLYVAWRNHEPEPGVFDWTTHDIVKFLELAKKHGFYAYLRPGPYITNEMDGGGYPYWVRSLSDKRKYDPLTPDGTMNLRTNDKDFMDAVERYFSALNKKILPYLYTNGGPIILYAVENEFDWGVRSFDLDKLSDMADGKPERPMEQNPDHAAYLAGLRDIVLKTGVDIPIAICPGDGLLGGTYEVPGVYPLPNIYGALNTVEYAVSQLRSLLRERPHYASTPIGITETHRHNWVLKRLLLSGADIITQFNIFAYHQEGRQNGMALDFPTFNNTLYLDDFSFSNPQAIVKVPMGLFPGAIDNDAAVTPSGALRDKFYAIRKTNLFIDAFETLLATADSPRRTATTILPVSGADHRVWVKNRAVGVNDPDAKTGKVNYWLPLGGEDNTDGSKGVILGLLNYDGTDDIVLKERDVEAFGAKFPVYSKLTVPTEYSESITKGPAPERRYTMFIPINVPIGDSGFKVDYATSEILTFRTWGKKTVLVLFNKAGTQGEIKLSSAAPGYTIKDKTVRGMHARVIPGRTTPGSASATATTPPTQTTTATASESDTEETAPAAEATATGIPLDSIDEWEDDERTDGHGSSRNSRSDRNGRQAESKDNSFTFTYTHSKNEIRTVTLTNGVDEFQIIVIDSQAAGRTWIMPLPPTPFTRSQPSEAILINVDYLQPSTGTPLIQQLPNHNEIITISPQPIVFSRSVTSLKKPWSTHTGVSRFTLTNRAEEPVFEIRLDDREE